MTTLVIISVAPSTKASSFRPVRASSKTQHESFKYGYSVSVLDVVIMREHSFEVEGLET
jgi:hypothetical protein